MRLFSGEEKTFLPIYYGPHDDGPKQLLQPQEQIASSGPAAAA